MSPEACTKRVSRCSRAFYDPPSVGVPSSARLYAHCPPVLGLKHAMVRLRQFFARSPSNGRYRLTADRLAVFRYSSGMRTLIRQLLKKDHHARPSTGAVLRQPLIKGKIGRFLSDAQASSERGRGCLCVSSSCVSFAACWLSAVLCGVAWPSSRAIRARFVARPLTSGPLAATPLVGQTSPAVFAPEAKRFRWWQVTTRRVTLGHPLASKAASLSLRDVIDASTALHFAGSPRTHPHSHALLPAFTRS